MTVAFGSLRRSTTASGRVGTRPIAGVIAVCVLLVAGTGCGSKHHAAPVHPLHPDYYGVAVRQQPSLNGEFKPHRKQDVMLTFADGRRILVPASATYYPTWDTVGCRTQSPIRADGSCSSPCQLQVGLATHERARWVRSFGSSGSCGHVGPVTTQGPIAFVTKRWLVTQDGTALPLPANGKVRLECMFPHDPSTPTTVVLPATAVQTKVRKGVMLDINLDTDGRVVSVVCKFGA
jgi:hypothetical protein